ncbi:MAG: T9SS type A sorting domain-containing protein [Bacteroidetes bacterium]|nr:T9SS type A sorting domain-containing protein [Bacteroidota bacterium]
MCFAKIKFFSVFLFIVIALSSFAQKTTFDKSSVTVEGPFVVNFSAVKEDYAVSLLNTEMPSPNSYRGNLIELKKKYHQEFLAKKQSNTNTFKTNHNGPHTSIAPEPLVLDTFEANLQNSGYPLDNDMAISNAGILVSVINSIIYIYDTNNNDTLLFSKTLHAFSSVLGINQSKYDPKVIYDPEADRFIMVYLNGYIGAQSKIILAFSQTNDPTGNWNFYFLPGNPFNNNLWSDYPIVAITKQDFFLTVNLIKTNALNPNWKTDFVESLIWQVQKQEGYNGQPLIDSVYHNIKFDNRNIRNLFPVKGGAELLGPNLYLLSNRNFAQENDSLFLVEITDHLTSGNASVKIKLLKSPTKYFLVPDARQKNGLFLQTNDSRVLGGFLHNDKIQFVQHTKDTTTGFAAIYHGIVTNLQSENPVISHVKIIGDSVLDFGYPNLSYCGSYINYSGATKPENESLITFSHSSPTDFAGVSAIYYSNENGYSNVIKLKEGSNVIDQASGAYERWGDYSGSQKKYNEPSVVWISSSFGKSNKKYGTFVAKLGSPQSERVTPKTENTVLVYPNPTENLLSVNFFLEEQTNLKFNIYDMQGKLVITLLEEFSKKGQNIFSFSTIPLNRGLYNLVIESETKTILKEKIVKH